MMRSVFLVFVLLVLLIVSLATAIVSTSAGTPPPDNLATFSDEIDTYLGQRRTGLESLIARHEACADLLARIEMQKDIQSYKRETEAGWLELQLQRAERRGDLAGATLLSQAVARLRAEASGASEDDPPPVGPLEDGGAP